MFLPKLLPTIALTLGLGLTFWLWRQDQTATIRKDQLVFEAEASNIADLISDRFEIYVNTLRAGVGLFIASDNVTRSDWNRFVAILNLRDNFPGIQAMAFIPKISLDRHQSHINQIRAEGFPDYIVHPPGPRPNYYPVLYIEPFTDTNLAVFGYDIGSEPVRQASLEASQKTGLPRLTSKITLVQDDGNPAQPGFLLFYPVFKEDQLLGFVDIAFRISDLIPNIIGDRRLIADFEIFSGSDMLLYDTDAHPHLSYPSETQKPSLTRKLDLAGQTWTMYFTPRPGFSPPISSNRPSPVLVVGAVISLLFAGLIHSFSTTSSKAVLLARAMTERLRSSEASLNTAQSLTHVGSWEWDVPRNQISWSDELYRIYGLSPLSSSISMASLSTPALPDYQSRLESLLHTAHAFGQGFELDYRILDPEGVERSLSLQCLAEIDPISQKTTRIFGTVHDVTDLAATTAQLKARNAELERLNRLLVGRELKMIELKRQINQNVS